MEQALNLAEQGRGCTSPNPMVGAVLVKKDKIIGKGYHEKYGGNHAEVNAFLNTKEEDFSDCTLYVTLEPCSHYGKTPPCANRIIKERVKRVVIAMLDPNPIVSGSGIKRLQEAGITVTVGILKEQARLLNECYIKYIKTRQPFVLLKSAMSLDGKIATRTGESKWISCEQSREEVHFLRKYYSGILVGIGTVLTDNPMLTCRIPNGTNPIRIIADSKLKIPLSSHLVQTADELRTIVACTNQVLQEERGQKKKEELEEKKVEVLPIAEDKTKQHIDLKQLITKIGELGIDSVLLEGGSTLAYGALKAGIVDKIRFYYAPVLIGGETAKSSIGGFGICSLKEAFPVEQITTSISGSDLVIEGYLAKERKENLCSQESLKKLEH